MIDKRDFNEKCWNISWDEYKELVHFCRQYEQKRRDSAALLTLPGGTPTPMTGKDGSAQWAPHGSGGLSDPVALAAEKRERLLRDIRMIERAAKIAGDEIAPWLLRNVTGKETITQIIARGCPISERQFYRMRRRFFFILRELKNGGAGI